MSAQSGAASEYALLTIGAVLALVAAVPLVGGALDTAATDERTYLETPFIAPDVLPASAQAACSLWGDASYCWPLGTAPPDVGSWTDAERYALPVCDVLPVTEPCRIGGPGWQ